MMKLSSTLRRCVPLFVLLFALEAVGLLVSPACAQQVTWATPTEVADGNADAYNLDMDVTSDGTAAIAVWYQSDGTHSIIRAATATISSGVATWSSPISISASGQNASQAKVVISNDGTRATAIWRRSTGISGHALQARSATISGNVATWGATYDLSTAINPFDGQIALSDDGSTAAVVWVRWTGSYNTVGFSVGSISGNSGSWSTATDISANGLSAYYPQVALSSDGSKGVAIWTQTNGSELIAYAAPFEISSGSPTLGATAGLSQSGNSATYPQIALSSDGSRATAVWIRYDGSFDRCQSASATISSNSATWGSVTNLDMTVAGEYVEEPMVALSSGGTAATATWMQGGRARAASAIISGISASWSSPVTISGTDTSAARISLSSDGTRAVAVWDRFFYTTPYKRLIQSAAASISGNVATWGIPNDASLPETTPLEGYAYHPLAELSGDGTKVTTVFYRYNTSSIISVQSNQGTVDYTVPTATPTATSTPTAVPLTPTATPTPAVGAGEIRGVIRDINGAPLSGILVYLLPKQRKTSSPRENGIDVPRSALTDSMGAYVVDDVADGTYIVVPAYNGYTFIPSRIEIQPGSFAPQISAADNFPIARKGCRAVDFAGAIANADLMSFKVLDFALTIADDARRLSEGVGRGDRAELLRTIDNATLRLNRSYARIIALSRRLPSRTVICRDRTTCETKNYELQVFRYRAWLGQLRSLSLFVIRTGREQIGGSPFTDATVTTVRSLHRAARRAVRELPRSTRQCV